MKPTKTVMSFCDEMFDSMQSYGKNYPWNWKQKTREKMEICGLVELKGKSPSYGSEYYFTDSGLDWYLNLRPERKMQRGS